MESKDKKDLIAPCGIFCGACEPYMAKDDPVLLERLVAMGIKREALPCLGCRPGDGRCLVLTQPCKTWECVKEHKVEFCYECAEFPCVKLHPSADRANVLPHNLKVFNLCCVQRDGAEKFIEKYPETKRRYYMGKMSVGDGPQVV